MRVIPFRSFLWVSLFAAFACQSHTDAKEGVVMAAASEPASEPAVPDVAKDGVADVTCTKDSDCQPGHVCESCGKRSECAPGCHTDDQCPKGERCAQVQCIRCPCPGQCFQGGK